MLKGERPEPYLSPSRERKIVCQLCAPRAQREGWIRESANPAMPVQAPRPRERKRLFRLRRRPSSLDQPADSVDALYANGRDGVAGERDGEDESGKLAVRLPRRRFRGPRHVRAVPTSADLKMERAVELFNGSEHPRRVAGIARSLGTPQVNAFASRPSAAEVSLTVAWDISWYQYVVDLSDTDDPIRLEARGHELSELSEEVCDWNAHAKADGTLVLGVPVIADGDQPDEGL
jgi:hypothetical protein